MVADPVMLWTEFLETRYHDKVLELAELYPDQRSLVIQFGDISHFNPELADALLETPKKILASAKEALFGLDIPIDVSLDKAHIRIVGLPRIAAHKPRTIRADLREQLIAVSGMVRSVSEVRPLMVSAAFQCQRCGYVFLRPQDHLRFDDQNLRCQNEACDRGGPFKLDVEHSKFFDSQRLILVDPPEESRGTDAGGLDVLLLDDLIAKDEFSKLMLRPGDRITINGILHFVQRTIGQQRSTQFDTWLEPISIERPETDYAQIDISAEDEAEILRLSKDPHLRERLIASVAPSIFGMEDVKEGVLLQLFGSDRFTDPRDGRTKRGDIHILMMGDPSVAKSEILNWVAENTPRCVYTSGKGSTTAGLTATAVKEDDRWQLSAGALVMANGGLICIDEIGQMNKEETSALHQAMEQQYISIAKAGIIADLPTQCSVLAAGNPKSGRIDKYEPLMEQIGLAAPLFTRFDLVYVLQDNPDKDKDAQIARHVLVSRICGGDTDMEIS